MKNPNQIFISTLLALGFLALSPIAQAIEPAAPDTALPGGNTADGQLALASVTSGSFNSAFGIFSLLSLTDGSFCTGVGAGTLLSNTGSSNTATGAGALFSNTTGTDNTADGAFALFSNTATGNTAIGSSALLNNASGGTLGNVAGLDVGPNVAVGWQALESNTVASANTAVGYQALHSFTTGPVGFEQIGLCTAVGFQALANATGDGFGNSGFGYQALMSNTDGIGNTAIGLQALFSNDTGSNNTAVGNSALLQNTTGFDNTAIGSAALSTNNTGSQNTALGRGALSANTDGIENTATGVQALSFNNTGSGNTANGYQALVSNTSGTSNTAVGFHALFGNSIGQSNTALGTEAGNSVTGSGNVCIGQGVIGEVGVDDHTYIRNINTTSVSGGNADFVTVDLGTGLLGHLSSSRRYKEDIKPMDDASEALYQLKPVTYRYKKEIDRTQSLDYGLIAEDVAKIDPNLTMRGKDGQIESVRYNTINAMLLNEFLKEHRKVEAEQVIIAELKSGMKSLAETVKEQAAQIQKVSARIEASGPAPKVVLNNP